MSLSENEPVYTVKLNPSERQAAVLVGHRSKCRQPQNPPFPDPWALNLLTGLTSRCCASSLITWSWYRASTSPACTACTA